MNREGHLVSRPFGLRDPGLTGSGRLSGVINDAEYSANGTAADDLRSGTGC